MRIFSGLAIAALISGGCVDRERPTRKQMPGEVSRGVKAENRTVAKKDAEEYARQANANAIKGEDFPENEAPPTGGRKGK